VKKPYLLDVKPFFYEKMPLFRGKLVILSAEFENRQIEGQ
jgi:hypothetical protein